MTLEWFLLCTEEKGICLHLLKFVHCLDSFPIEWDVCVQQRLFCWRWLMWACWLLLPAVPGYQASVRRNICFMAFCCEKKIMNTDRFDALESTTAWLSFLMSGLDEASWSLPPPKKIQEFAVCNFQFLSSDNCLGYGREHLIILEFDTKAKATVYWAAYIHSCLSWAGSQGRCWL